MTLHRLPNRRAVCPSCGKTVSAYVPTANVPEVDGAQTYIFRSHSGADGQPCTCWASRVPDDAFTDGKPNIDV